MISHALRVEIEVTAVSIRQTNPLLTKAERGQFTSEMLTRYLSNIRVILRETPISLSRAAARARAIGDDDLARHWEAKRGEEEGHDHWAESDLASVTMRSTIPPSLDELPSARAIIDFQRAVIDEDPALYLSYVLFTEYLTLLLGPEWLRNLSEKCGIPRSSMTVIDNHIELDKDHVEEALENIDALVGDPRKLPRMREVVRESIALFEKFCVEVTEEAHHDVPAPVVARPRTTAA